MMKRLLSPALSLMMLLTLTAPAAQAAEVKPTPPEWVKAEEYAVLADGEAYQKENWDKILRLRADAEAGHLAPEQGSALYDDYQRFRKAAGAPSLQFEQGLLAVRYACNAAAAGKPVGRMGDNLDMAAYYAKDQEPAYRVMRLWNARCRLWEMEASSDIEKQGRFVSAVEYLLPYEDFTMEQLYDCDLVRWMPKEKLDIARSILFVTLDGAVVHPRAVIYSAANRDHSQACVRNGRTMVPVRRLAELMGAEVAYQSGRVTITRGGDTIVMTIGSKQAQVNGSPLEMDVAPYIENGRTYIPVRYMAEFFGQTVEWVGRKQQVAVCENKAAVQPSNLEAWALPMGAMLNHMNNAAQETLFGGKERWGSGPVGKPVSNRLETTGPDFGRGCLADSWSIYSREDLIETVCSMTSYGHNAAFLADAAMIKSLSPSEYQTILKNAQGMDAYMFPYTKELSKKWGDRGILCWDLFRMSNLVQWGYLAGYITYPEALALLEPAATLLHDNFKSWDEAYENYLDGYNWWARNDVLGKDVWTTQRGTVYRDMKNDLRIAPIFDDALFNAPVKGVPGLTAEQLLASIS